MPKTFYGSLHLLLLQGTLESATWTCLGTEKEKERSGEGREALLGFPGIGQKTWGLRQGKVPSFPRDAGIASGSPTLSHVS